MKAPILIALLASFAISAHADDASERAARQKRLDAAWDNIDDAGSAIAGGVENAIDTVVGGVRDIAHQRPELQGIPHLVVLSKGKNVKVAYCRSMIGQIFHNMNTGKIGKNRCEEVLTKGSFDLEALQACAANNVREPGDSASFIKRELARIDRRNEDYGYNFIGMSGTKDDYRFLFNKTCASARIKPAQVAKPRPKDNQDGGNTVDRNAPEGPGFEFHPVDHSGDVAPAEQPSGQLQPALNPTRL